MARRFYTFDYYSVVSAALLKGQPLWATVKNRPTAARRAGLRYEARAQAHLHELYPEELMDQGIAYLQSPWIIFSLKGEPMPKYCQPDGLIIDLPKSRITVVEIKLKHTADAHTQLAGIYTPVVRRIFPGFQIRTLELTRWYDPAIDFPVPVQLVSDISLVPSGRMGVHIWTP